MASQAARARAAWATRGPAPSSADASTAAALSAMLAGAERAGGDGLPVEAANVLLGDADGGSAAAQAQALLGQLGGALQPSLTLQLAAVQAQAQAGHAGDAAAVAETQTALTAAALARMTAPPDDPQPPMI